LGADKNRRHFIKNESPSTINIIQGGNAVSEKETIIIKNYTGSKESATRQFQKDATQLAAQGYYPTSQSWAPGAYGCGSFIFALLLCLILIGILVFIYMLLVKPDGTLSVTYQLRINESEAKTTTQVAGEKTCPKCAENIKEAAVICRFCGHNFEKN
jgi:hypothetical protein